MADQDLLSLPAASVIGGADVFYLVQGGTSKKVPFSGFLNGGQQTYLITDYVPPGHTFGRLISLTSLSSLVSYVGGTGVVTVTTAAPHGLIVGGAFLIASVTGTGADLNALNGWNVAIAGTTGSTLVFAVATGLTITTVTGGALSAPATLSAYYGPTGLAAAQAVYPFATSVANYADRCSVQLALNTCTAGGGGITQCPRVSIYLDTSLTWDPSITTLNGVLGGANYTNFLTEACGTNPAFAVAVVTGLNLNGNVGFSNLNLLGLNAGAAGFPQSGSGVANTGFRTGGIAIGVTNCANGVLGKNVEIYNFDTPYTWGGGSNIYCLTFENFVHVGNNYGPNAGTISTASTATAFERMIWIGGSHSNNNYGYVFNLGGLAGSVFLLQTSIDYNIVRAGWYDALAGGSDCQIPLFLDVIHNESNGATSGYTVAPFYNNGRMFLSNVEGYWNDGTNPIGWVEPGSTSASTHFSNCVVPGVASGVPAVYTNSFASATVTAHGLTNRYYPTGIALSQTTAGITMFRVSSELWAPLSASYTLALGYQTVLNALSTGGIITIALDSASDPFIQLVLNHAVGVSIEGLLTTANGWTVTGALGVTVNGVSAGSASIAATAGLRFWITKVAANTWIVR